MSSIENPADPAEALFAPVQEQLRRKQAGSAVKAWLEQKRTDDRVEQVSQVRVGDMAGQVLPVFLNATPKNYLQIVS